MFVEERTKSSKLADFGDLDKRHTCSARRQEETCKHVLLKSGYPSYKLSTCCFQELIAQGFDRFR